MDIEREAAINLLSIIRQKYTSHIDSLLALPVDLFSGYKDTEVFFTTLKRFREEEIPYEDIFFIESLQNNDCEEDIVDEVARAKISPLSSEKYLDTLIQERQKALTEDFAYALESGKIKNFRASTQRLLMQHERLESLRMPRIRASDMKVTRQIMESSLLIPSFSSGFSQVDDILGGGFRSEEMTTLGAPPGTGKSALAAIFGLNVAESIADGGVLFFSKEMTKQKIYLRLLAHSARVPVNYYEEIQQGLRTPDEMTERKIRMGLARLDDIEDRYCFFDVQDSNRIGTEQIAEEVRAQNAAREQAGRKPVSLVIVDYLQYLNYEAQSRNEQLHQSIAGIAERLKQIALQEHCHMLVIAAVNRQSGRTMQLEAFRDSSGIEFNTDNAILMVNCKDFLSSASELQALGQGWGEEQMNPIMLRAPKVRNGVVGRNGFLAFNGALQTFRDMTGDEIGALRSIMSDSSSERPRPH